MLRSVSPLSFRSPSCRAGCPMGKSAWRGCLSGRIGFKGIRSHWAQFTQTTCVRLPLPHAVPLKTKICSGNKHGVVEGVDPPCRAEMDEMQQGHHMSIPHGTLPGSQLFALAIVRAQVLHPVLIEPPAHDSRHPRRTLPNHCSDGLHCSGTGRPRSRWRSAP